MFVLTTALLITVSSIFASQIGSASLRVQGDKISRLKPFIIQTECQIYKTSNCYFETTNDGTWIGNASNDQLSIFEREGENHTIVLGIKFSGAVTVISGKINSICISIPCVVTSCDEIYAWFKGPAIFAPIRIERMETQACLKYQAMEPGSYKLLIDLISYHKKTFTVKRVQVPPNYSSLHVLPTKSLSDSQLPPCTNVDWNQGRWLPCAGEEVCPTQGLFFLPYNCYIPMVNFDKLRDENLWIVLTGSSVQRGTFLAIANMLLGDKMHAMIELGIWKCWNWLDLHVGRFRVSYLDMRLHYMSERLSSGAEPNYMRHAFEAIKSLVSSNEHPPDSFFIEMQDMFDANDLFHIESWFGAKYNGSVFVNVVKPSFGIQNETYKAFRKPSIRERLKEYKSKLEIIDESHMALPMWHTMEGLPFNRSENYQIAMHYHHLRETNGAKAFFTYVSDMCAHQLLSMTIQRRKIRKGLQVRPRSLPQPKICSICPASPTPWKMNVTITSAPCKTL
jgi:hypothetical protein